MESQCEKDRTFTFKRNKMATGGLFTQSIIEASDAIYDFPCSPCFEDGKNSEALFKCVECKSFYCQICLDGHQKFVKNHTVQDIKAIKAGQHTKSQPLAAPPVSIDEICEEHHGKVKDMFCKQHDEVCCAVCIALTHRSCKAVVYIPKVAKELLKGKDVGKVKSDLGKFARQLQNLKSKQKEFLKTMDKQRTKIIQSFHYYKTQMIQLIDVLEKSSVAEVDERCKAISDDINSDIEKTEQMLKDIRMYLHKLTYESCDDNAKLFVNLKIAERQTYKAGNFTANLYSKPVRKLDFKLDSTLELCLKQMPSFGNINISIQRNVPFVNLLVRCRTENIRFLQSDFLDIGIYSQFIQPSEIDPNVYTVVVYRGNDQLRGLHINSQKPDKIILLGLEIDQTLLQKAKEMYGLAYFPDWAEDVKRISVPSGNSGKGYTERALKGLLSIITK